MHKAFVVAVAALVSAGCGAAGSHPARSAPTPPGSDLRSVTLTAAELRGLATADTAFGTQLLQRLQKDKKGNLALSPASIATALQMAFVGARGATATEMAKTLHLEGMSPQQAAAAASRLLDGLAPLARDKDELLDLVNAVWVQNGLALTPAYDAMMRTGFGAALRRTDFGHSEQARQTINAAVAQATRDKIRELIAQGQNTPDTRLVLTNAVYMKAKWSSPFEPSQTRPRTFHRADGTTQDAPTMAQTGELDYARGPGYQAVRLPYLGGRLAMTLVVPVGADTGYPARLARFHPAEVDLWLPKFQFTWSHELSAALQALGMRTAFDGGADFGGMTSAEPLHVSFVQHQAFINVDEHGTEAAAATAIGMGVSGAFGPRQTFVVHADHPFYFSISDTQTGLMLFLGHIADPAAN